MNRYAAAKYAATHSELAMASRSTPKTKFVPFNRTPQIAKGSAYKPQANLTQDQLTIIDGMTAAADAGSNLLITARAGTSKTTVLIEGMYRLDPSLSVAYFIFAKRNQVEAESKAPPHVVCQTVHALGLRAIKNAANGSITIDDKGDKAEAIARGLFGSDDEKNEARYNYTQALGLCKAYLCETSDDVAAVVEKHDIDLLEDSESEFYSKILKGLELSAKQRQIVDFNDMVWLPVKLGLRLPQYDVVCADECQDLSPARIKIILGTLKPGGRFIAVGDDRQSIFSWTGSDAQALITIQEETRARTLPLNTTFRCGRKIVELCRSIVPSYEAHESNAEGNVEEKSVEQMLAEVQPGDAILSRVNAPLVNYALQLLKAGKRANILGRDIGKGLLFMIKRSRAIDVNGFLDWLNEWSRVECERRVKKNQDTTQITDKVLCMESFCEGTNDLALVRSRVSEMFSDKEEGSFVILSSIHRFKGMERESVWVMSNTLKVGKSVEEDNLAYVAWSRAKNNLYLVK
jgi:superfamily I DNA/RNA helicase